MYDVTNDQLHDIIHVQPVCMTSCGPMSHNPISAGFCEHGSHQEMLAPLCPIFQKIIRKQCVLLWFSSTGCQSEAAIEG